MACMRTSRSRTLSFSTRKALELPEQIRRSPTARAFSSSTSKRPERTPRSPSRKNSNAARRFIKGNFFGSSLFYASRCISDVFASKEHFMNVFVRLFAIVSLAIAMIAPTVNGQKSYDPGASDTEIRIGNIAPYTGWAKEYSSIARAEAAYFQMIDDRGGINGRKNTFVSVDNASEVSKS